MLANVCTTYMFRFSDEQWKESRCQLRWRNLAVIRHTTLLVSFFQGAASGVRVNSVVPGHVETPIYGDMPRDMLVGVTGTTQLIARPIEPEEVRRSLPYFR